MSLLKNKHVITAMIVAPILAIITFFATDYVVSEQPQAAQEGSSYKLAGRPNCRYTSGVCTLKNGDVLMDISFDNAVLNIDSQLALNGVKVALNDNAPLAMNNTDTNNEKWQVAFPTAPSVTDTLKLAIESNGVVYYAEQSLGFIKKKTLTD